MSKVLVEFASLWSNFQNGNWILAKVIAKYVTTNELGVVAGLFIAVLLPVVILLLETVSGNVWDVAVLLRKVVGLKRILVGTIMISISIFLWQVTVIRVILLLLYLIGMVLLFEILFLSARWLADWDENYPTGFRYVLRASILADSSLKINQRLRIWQVYLESVVSKNERKISGFTDARQFSNLFKINYQLSGDSQNRFLSLTAPYLASILEPRISYEKEFFRFGFSEMFDSGRTPEEFELYSIWKEVLDEQCAKAATDQYKSIVLMQIFEEMRPQSIEPETENVYIDLSKRICELLWTRAKDNYEDQLILNSKWRIQYSTAVKNNSEGRAQRQLFSDFWQIVEEKRRKSANYDDMINLNNLAISLFSSADPVILDRMYRLFGVGYFPEFDSDWNSFLIDRLSNVFSFGLMGRVTTYWESENSKEGMKIFAKQQKENHEESMKLALLSLPILRDKDRLKYIQKSMQTLDSKDFTDSLKKKKTQIDNDTIAMYKDLLKETSELISSRSIQ